MALVRSSRSLGRGPDQTSCLHHFPSIERSWVHQTCCIASISSQNSAREYRLCRARQDNNRPCRQQHIYTYKPARRRRGSGRSSFTAVTSSQFDTTSGSDAQVRLIAALRQGSISGLYLLACFTCWFRKCMFTGGEQGEHFARAATRHQCVGLQALLVSPSVSRLPYILWVCCKLNMAMRKGSDYFIGIRCQPWTILGTGAALTAFANLVSHGSVLWTLVVGIPISAWWFLFLVVYPAQYREYVKEQRSFQQLDED